MATDVGHVSLTLSSGFSGRCGCTKGGSSTPPPSPRSRERTVTRRAQSWIELTTPLSALPRLSTTNTTRRFCSAPGSSRWAPFTT